MSNLIPFLVLGLVAGVVGGLVGVGGGIVMIPALVLIFGFNQQLAQGTTTAAMVPPIGILAAYVYYRNGNVNLKVAGLICIGFLIGGLLGAELANRIPSKALEKVFAVALMITSVRILFR
jgi:uncharacterized protein